MRCSLLLPTFSICLSIGLSVTRFNSAPLCKNGWTDPDPVWGEHSWRPKKHCVRWDSWSPTAREGGFDAAFAKLLWPLVLALRTQDPCKIHQIYSKYRQNMSIHSICYNILYYAHKQSWSAVTQTAMRNISTKSPYKGATNITRKQLTITISLYYSSPLK